MIVKYINGVKVCCLKMEWLLIGGEIWVASDGGSFLNVDDGSEEIKYCINCGTKVEIDPAIIMKKINHTVYKEGAEVGRV